MKILAVLSAWYPHYTSSSIGVVVDHVSDCLRKQGITVDICAPIGGNINLINTNILKRTRIFEPVDHFYRMIFFWFKALYFIKNNYEKYDVFWIHNPNPIIWRFVNKKYLDKIIFTIHSTYGGMNKKIKFESIKLNIFYNFMTKNEKKFFDKIKSTKNSIIVFSPECIKDLTDFGIDDEKIMYIPNGVDINYFKPISLKMKRDIRQKFGFPQNKIIMLSLGRLDEVKKPIKLIKTFLVLEKYCDNVFLIVIGKGDELQKIKKMTEKNKNILIMGYVNIMDESNSDLIACCDAYITTSSYEGQPLALLESMSSGLLCIISKIPNLEKIVQSAKCGISLSFDDAELAANEIANFFKMNKISTFGLNARRYIENNHDWDLVSRKYLEEFKKITKG
jgi:glycosyltransferase involved in cell wall biosynthesis